MSRFCSLLRVAPLAAALLIPISHAGAQRRSDNWLDDCRSRSGDRGGDRYRFCELRDAGLHATGHVITADGRQNGGISVSSWDRDSIAVVARVQTWARSESEARDIASHIQLVTENGDIRAEGPSDVDDGGWSVSYDITVPRRSDLTLRTHNGGISVTGVNGRIDVSAMNGGISMDSVAGDVHGETRNGGISLSLAGDRWDGRGVDLTTTNGGLHIEIPDHYSAQLETGTRNGHMEIDFPVTVQGRLDRMLTTQLGEGGPTIHVVTTNGGVELRRR